MAKGFYLLTEVLGHLLQAHVQFVILGNGEEDIENAFNHFKHAYPDKFAFYRGYNEPLATKFMQQAISSSCLLCLNHAALAS